MTGYTPPRPSGRTTAAALAIVVAGLFWSVLIDRVDAAVTILLLAALAYAVWRIVRALDAIADGTQRTAAAHERGEVENGSGDGDGDRTDHAPD